MLILKHNRLLVDDLFIIERHLVRWLDRKGPKITPEWHVLELSRTDLYGHLLGIFAHLKIFDALAIDPSRLLDFLVDVDSAYLHTPYHSFYHAADILIMLYYILIELDGIKQVSVIELAPLLIAALCHDMGHPGYNNLYQVNSKTPLAQQYNNTSVLENYSVDITHALLIKHKLFDNVSYDWKDLIKRLILSTDMVYHYELQERMGALNQFMGNTWSDEDNLDDSDQENSSSSSNNDTDSNSDTDLVGLSQPPPTPTIDHFLDHSFKPQSTSPRQCHDFCRIILHAADISNTVRPWSISKQWSDLIVQEFFHQGDAEKLCGLTVSPGMDRDESDQAAISLKFGEFVIKPYFESFSRLLPKARVFLDTLDKNRLEWIKLKGRPMSPMSPMTLPPHERHHLSIRSLPNVPFGRRVSVPAGLVVIPDHRLVWKRKRRHTPLRRITKSSPLQHLRLHHRYTMRSASHPVIILHRSMNQVSRLIQIQQNVKENKVNLVISKE